MRQDQVEIVFFGGEMGTSFSPDSPEIRHRMPASDRVKCHIFLILNRQGFIKKRPGSVRVSGDFPPRERASECMVEKSCTLAAAYVPSRPP